MGAVHWINPEIQLRPGDVCEVRARHRGALIEAEVVAVEDGLSLRLTNPERAVSAGQSVVIYSGENCLGGGIVV